jgi:hypothetical protein
MQVLKGKVIGGNVVVEGGVLPEGTKVTILAQEKEEAFELRPEDEAALLEALAEADRGETIDPETLFREIRNSS